jgi:hypothetical protein
MELVLLAILTMAINVLGKEAYILASGLLGLHLLKKLTPSWVSPMRKRVWAMRK